MRHLILAALFLMVFGGAAQAACPATLTDCPSINANTGRFGGGMSSVGMMLDARVEGADPTGGADSTSAVLAALTKACAYPVPVPLFFPTGSYRFNTRVQVPCSNLRIYGTGPTSKLVAGMNAVQNGLFFYIPPGTTNTTIDHLGFDGSAPTVGGDGAFILSVGATGLHIVDNYFTNNRYLIAANNSPANGVQISRNIFHNVSTWQQTLPTWTVGSTYTSGQLVYSPAGAGLYKQTVASCTSVALGLGPTGNGTGIADNTCSWDFVRSSVIVTNTIGAGSGNSFDDNYMDSCIGGDPLDTGDQIDFRATNNTIISDNSGYVQQVSGAGSGLYVTAATSAGSVGTVIANNYITGMTGNGIDVTCIIKATITGNIVLNSGGAGSALTGSGSLPCSPRQISYTGNVLMNSNQGAAGKVSIATNAVTAAGSNVLNFASTTGVVDGYFVFDNTLTGTTVPVGAKVLSHTGTTVTMSVNAIGTGVTNGQNVSFFNRYPRPPAPQAGIWLGCIGGACTMSDIVVANNVVTDDQATKTQPWALQNAATVTNLRISQDNAFKGNATADMTGTGALYLDAGTGSNAWACTPGSGNTAAGNFGSMVCGFASAASGTGSRAMGTNVIAAGIYSDVAGNGVSDFTRYGWQGYSSGGFVATGDAQAGRSVLRGTGSTTAVIRPTTDKNAATLFNCFNIAANRVQAINVTVVAIDHTVPANNETWLNWAGLMMRGAGTTTTVTMQATPTPITNGTVAGSSIAITGDNTNACLNVAFTPPSGNTDVWNVIAEVRSAEVQ